ncbi:autotransporter outer membrane beta-barrel domain-containing protein [Yersinia kristensenii]|uniref:autotransporter outer membrane beta-barrel domain-containing protein n=1 Tax=Yersinia kristensenii TaxID=28152 RepID=UPI001F0F3A2C|nr:autotransporter outer membrane beta-barrel domain-containing protein [Yersinia kristensenii]MDA5476077.1 autotransporter outer membrane beta-barrel domain-containing protein [Yersinia kristensenii]
MYISNIIQPDDHTLTQRISSNHAKYRLSPCAKAIGALLLVFGSNLAWADNQPKLTPEQALSTSQPPQTFRVNSPDLDTRKTNPLREDTNIAMVTAHVVEIATGLPDIVPSIQQSQEPMPQPPEPLHIDVVTIATNLVELAATMPEFLEVRQELLQLNEEKSARKTNPLREDTNITMVTAHIVEIATGLPDIVPSIQQSQEPMPQPPEPLHIDVVTIATNLVELAATMPEFLEVRQELLQLNEEKPAAGAVAKPAAGAVAKPADGAVAKPAAGAVAKPADGAVAKPADGAVAKPADGAVAKPAAEAVAKPADGAVAKPADGAVAKPAAGAVAKPAAGAVAKPADGAVAKPADGAVAKPAAGAVAKPAAGAVAKPADEAVAKPADGAVAKPADGAKPDAKAKTAPSRPQKKAPVLVSKPAPIIGHNPQVGSYIANQIAAQQMFITDDLQHRLGETRYIDPVTGEEKVSSLWLNTSGAKNRFNSGNDQLRTKSNRYAIQLGGTVSEWSSGGDDQGILGITAGLGKSTNHSHSTSSHHQAQGSVDGYNLGLYSIWYADNQTRLGPYIDLLTQYGWFNNQVKAPNVTTAAHYKSYLFTGALETGYKIQLLETADTKLSIQPRAKVLWQRTSGLLHKEPNAILINVEENNTVTTKLGIRTVLEFDIDTLSSAKNLQISPSFEANWIHSRANQGVQLSRAYATPQRVQDKLELASVNVSPQGNNNIADLKLGIEANIDSNLRLWTYLGHQFGGHNYSDTQATVGMNYHF